jgi:hypothetical protein
MLPIEQNAQHERRKGVWRNQPRRLWFQKAVVAAIAKDEKQFRDRQLKKNDAEDQKNSRVLLETFWLIDPQLGNCSRQDQERNDVIFRGLGLLTAKNKKRQTTSEKRKDKYL